MRSAGKRELRWQEMHYERGIPTRLLYGALGAFSTGVGMTGYRIREWLQGTVDGCQARSVRAYR